VEYIVVFLRNLAVEKFGKYFPELAVSHQAEAVAGSTKTMFEIEGWMADSKDVIGKAFQIGTGKEAPTELEKNEFIEKFRLASDNGSLAAMNPETYDSIASVMFLYLHNLGKLKEVEENLARASRDEPVFFIAGQSPTARVMTAGDQQTQVFIKRRETASRFVESGGVPDYVAYGNEGGYVKFNLQEALDSTERLVKRETDQNFWWAENPKQEADRANQSYEKIKALQDYVRETGTKNLYEAVASLGWSSAELDSLISYISLLQKGAFGDDQSGLSEQRAGFIAALENIRNSNGVPYVKEGLESLELSSDNIDDRVINLKFIRKSNRHFTIRSDYEPVFHDDGGDGSISFKRCVEKPGIKVTYRQVAESVVIEVEIEIVGFAVGNIEKEDIQSMDSVKGDPVISCIIQMGYRVQFPDWTRLKQDEDIARFYDLDHNNITLDKKVQRGQEIQVQILTGYSESYPPDKKVRLINK
jgi:hypothetical protein